MRAALTVPVRACLVALLLAGCTDPAPEMRELRISGTASLHGGASPQGVLHVLAYHAGAGEGQLRHPLAPIGEFTAETGTFSGSVQYAAGAGEGLVVYAWLDTDGDGVLCTPNHRSEPAGLVVVEGFPADEVRVSLSLVEPCKAANWFFPPASGPGVPVSGATG